MTIHPGIRIHREIFRPSNLTLAEIARRTEISYPTLNNLAKGRISLTQRTAEKISKVFQLNPHQLMQWQLDYEKNTSLTTCVASAHVPYSCPLLDFHAINITAWAESAPLQIAYEFPVFVRTLIRSTTEKIQEARIPGFESVNEPGWDGMVLTSDMDNEWVPEGKSCWEFGTTKQSTKAKIDSDYNKRSDSLTAKEKAETTFVFATPRKWRGINKWKKEHKNDGWKDLRVYDADDLEEWLAYSPSAQLFLAKRLQPAFDSIQGIVELAESWFHGQTDGGCLPLSLFDEWVAREGETLNQFLDSLPNGRVLSIVAGSVEVAQGFLASYALHERDLATGYRPILWLNDKTGIDVLRASARRFIIATANSEVAAVFYRLANQHHCIRAFTKGRPSTQQQIALTSISNEGFKKAFGENYPSQTIEQWYANCRGDLSIHWRLMNRETLVDDGFEPFSTDDIGTVLSLFFLGCCVKDSDGLNQNKDWIILRDFAAKVNYPASEKAFNRILETYGEKSPIWRNQNRYGIKSREEIFLHIINAITDEDIEAFYVTAKTVLQGYDRTLDVPEAKRVWGIGCQPSSLEFSVELREGICQTLEFLNSHQEILSKERRISLYNRNQHFVSNLMRTFDEKTLHANAYCLPTLAEISPRIFLDELRKNLALPISTFRTLMKPVVNLPFGGDTSRTYLLRALEFLSWQDSWFQEATGLLFQLMTIEPEDNLGNRPSESLVGIFNPFIKKTCVSTGTCLRILEGHWRTFPEAVLSVCFKLLSCHSIAYSSVPVSVQLPPNWCRTGSSDEIVQFYAGLCDLILSKADNWTQSEVSQLLQVLPESCVQLRLAEFLERIHYWLATKEWGNPIELLRQVTSLHRVFCHRENIPKNLRGDILIRLGEFKRMLRQKLPNPEEILFTQNADLVIEEIPRNRNLLESKEYVRKCLDVIRSVYESGGNQAILKLVQSSNGWGVYMVCQSLDKLSHFDRLGLVKDCIAYALENQQLNDLLRSQLLQMEMSERGSLLQEYLSVRPSLSHAIFRLLNYMPKDRVFFDTLLDLQEDINSSYWKQIPISELHHCDKPEKVVTRLQAVGRISAALSYCGMRCEDIPATCIYQVLLARKSQAAGSDSEVVDDWYGLDSYNLQQMICKVTQDDSMSLEQRAGIVFVYCKEIHPTFFTRSDEDLLQEQCLQTLELFIEIRPDFFALLVKSVYDNASTQIPAELAFHVLNVLHRIPGTQINGEINTITLVNWLENVQKHCFGEIGYPINSHIGQLFSRFDWSVSSEARTSLAEVIESIECREGFWQGMNMGINNSIGARFRSLDGATDRKDATMFNIIGEELEQFPRISRFFKQLALDKQTDGKQQDRELVCNRWLFAR